LAAKRLAHWREELLRTVLAVAVPTGTVLVFIEHLRFDGGNVVFGSVTLREHIHTNIWVVSLRDIKNMIGFLYPDYVYDPQFRHVTTAAAAKNAFSGGVSRTTWSPIYADPLSGMAWLSTWMPPTLVDPAPENPAPLLVYPLLPATTQFHTLTEDQLVPMTAQWLPELRHTADRCWSPNPSENVVSWFIYYMPAAE
jgi:hypothetical protein